MKALEQHEAVEEALGKIHGPEHLCGACRAERFQEQEFSELRGLNRFHAAPQGQLNKPHGP
jgi:hypothetical protein